MGRTTTPHVHQKFLLPRKLEAVNKWCVLGKIPVSFGCFDSWGQAFKSGLWTERISCPNAVNSLKPCTSFVHSMSSTWLHVWVMLVICTIWASNSGWVHFASTVTQHDGGCLRWSIWSELLMEAGPGPGYPGLPLCHGWHKKWPNRWLDVDMLR